MKKLEKENKGSGAQNIYLRLQPVLAAFFITAISFFWLFYTVHVTAILLPSKKLFIFFFKKICVLW